MPGAWEIRSQNRMMLGIIHTDTTTIGWALGLRRLIVPGPVVAASGMPYDHCRNSICKKALDDGFDFVGFLDSDVIPPPDAFLRLMAHNLPIVSGVYCRRSTPHGVPVAIRKPGGWVQQLSGGLEEVDYVGAGLLLIRRDTLEKVPATRPSAGKRWFDWRVDMAGVKDPATGKDYYPPDECLSEDFSYCHWLKQNGIKTMLDTSIMAKHIGLAEAGFGTLQPFHAG